jgi:hypothetical protein
MGRGRSRRCHVVHCARAVVHMGQHQHRDIGGQRRCDLPRARPASRCPAALPAQRLGDVQVGREIAALADDGVALRRIFAGHVQRGAEHLEQVDGGAVRSPPLRSGRRPRGGRSCRPRAGASRTSPRCSSCGSDPGPIPVSPPWRRGRPWRWAGRPASCRRGRSRPSGRSN